MEIIIKDKNEYNCCNICPRRCGVNRRAGKVGYCRETDQMYVARAALHMWEEPVISGTKGSGTIFFEGCNMGCVFCQNYKISGQQKRPQHVGSPVSIDKLIELFYKLKGEGANNINLVTADIYLPSVASAIEKAKNRGFDLPVLLNTSSYLMPDTVKMLDGLVDIYLPDYKFADRRMAARYAMAPDYPERAFEAIREMVRQRGKCEYTEENSAEKVKLLKKGVVVRHLLMPHGLLNAKLCIKKLYDSFGEKIIYSVMNQFTAIDGLLGNYQELRDPVTSREYDELIDYAAGLGIKNGFMQEGGAVSESFIPEFGYCKN